MGSPITVYYRGHVSVIVVGDTISLVVHAQGSIPTRAIHLTMLQAYELGLALERAGDLVSGLPTSTDPTAGQAA